jgi:hypothetical protein
MIALFLPNKVPYPITYLVFPRALTTRFNCLSSDKEFSDTTMDALIQTNLSIMLTSTIDLFGEISAIVTGKSMVFLSGLPGQSLNIARFGVVIVWGILPGDCIKGCASVQLQR